MQQVLVSAWRLSKVYAHEGRRYSCTPADNVIPALPWPCDMGQHLMQPQSWQLVQAGIWMSKSPACKPVHDEQAPQQSDQCKAGDICTGQVQNEDKGMSNAVLRIAFFPY